jgi:hypothetical protein
MGWVCSGGPNLAPVPLGSVAGDPGRHRHRGWLVCTCTSPVPAAAGRGLRPRVFSAHRPGPQLPKYMPRHALCNSASFDKASSDRPTAQPSFFKPFSQSPGQILCRFRLALRQRKSGPRIALPAHRLYYPVDI